MLLKRGAGSDPKAWRIPPNNLPIQHMALFRAVLFAEERGGENPRAEAQITAGGGAAKGII